MCKFFKTKEQRADEAKLKAWSRGVIDTKFAPGHSMHHTEAEYKPKKQYMVPNLTCPRCKSNRILWAGYVDRVECEKCGAVFSR